MRARLEFFDLSKCWQGRAILQGITLSVGEGESVALLGRHGAGKTTAVMLALGLAAPDYGTVHVLGGRPGRRQARCQTGAMLQQATLPGDVRVQDMLALVRSYYPDPLRLEEAAAAAGLLQHLSTPVANLTEAERKSLRFALAICGRPRLLILDDPFSGLNAGVRARLCAVIRHFAEAGGSVMLTATYAEEIGEAASRICLLGHGAATAETTMRRLRAGDMHHRLPGRAAIPPVSHGPPIAHQRVGRHDTMPVLSVHHAETASDA